MLNIELVRAEMLYLFLKSNDVQSADRNFSSSETNDDHELEINGNNFKKNPIAELMDV